MTDTRRPDPLTAEGDPTWLNPATIKGAIAVAVGLLFLLFPGASVPLIRYGLGGALVFVGASDLWSYFARHDRTQPRYRLIAAVIAVIAGIGLIAWPAQTVRVVEIIFGLYLVLQGINIVIRTINTWEGKPSGFPLLRGLVYIGFGAAMFLVGEFLLSTLLVAGAILAIVAGLIMAGYGAQARTPEEAAALDSAGILAIVVAWLNERDLGSDKRATVANTLYFEAPDLVHKLVSYTVMLGLSVSIATLAILQDSTAVVIGAMLIAPLMTPIMGTAAAIVNGWRGRMVWSLIVVGISVVGAIGVAWVVATWAPALVPAATNSQITSRISPTLLDMGIALAAGAAGAYATVDDRVSASLPGVAIAVALVPPLGVVGVTLTLGMGGDALGAFLLFSTNFVSIILASVVVFVLTGFSPVRHFIEHRGDVINVLGTLVVGGLLIMIPLGLTGAAILNTASDKAAAQEVTQEWLGESSDLEVGPITVGDVVVSIDISGSDDLPAIEELEDALSETLGRAVTLNVEYFKTVRFEYSDSGGLDATDSGSSP